MIPEVATQLRQFARDSAVVAAVVVLALTSPLASDRAAAEDTLPGTVSVSRSEYIEICEETGGNPIEQSDGSVTCFYADGSWSQCWFDTGVCQDSPAIRKPPANIIVDPAAGLAAVDTGEAPLRASPGLQRVASDEGDARSAKAKHGKGKKAKKSHRGKRHRH